MNQKPQASQKSRVHTEKEIFLVQSKFINGLQYVSPFKPIIAVPWTTRYPIMISNMTKFENFCVKIINPLLENFLQNYSPSFSVNSRVKCSFEIFWN